uniref:BAG domain-containing protein n=1 Tax=Meloidogyne hapla TaxID=6305 RepID=A0A1I8BLV5_MELHA
MSTESQVEGSHVDRLPTISLMILLTTSIQYLSHMDFRDASQRGVCLAFYLQYPIHLKLKAKFTGLFDDDVDNFFDGFSRGGEHQIPFRDEPSFFRSSMPRRQYKPPTNFHGKTEGSSVERPIPIQLKQTSSSQPKSTSPILMEDQDEITENVHRIPIRQMTSSDNQKEQKHEPKNAPAKYEHNILPTEALTGHNPADKRRRFSNCQQRQNEHNYANSRNQFKSVPDIVIDDYGDGRITSDGEQVKSVVIPLPAPAIPLPAPQQRIKVENERRMEEMEDEKQSEVNVSENEYTTVQGDRDELVLNADRIINRCRSVDVCVNTPRDEHQNQALQHVNEVICTALNKTDDTLKTKAKIQGFLNACMAEENGHIDDKFQSLIIACTADDQKSIRRRLVKIIEQIEQTQQVSQLDSSK